MSMLGEHRGDGGSRPGTGFRRRARPRDCLRGSSFADSWPGEMSRHSQPWSPGTGRWCWASVAGSWARFRTPTMPSRRRFSCCCGAPLRCRMRIRSGRGSTGWRGEWRRGLGRATRGGRSRRRKPPIARPEGAEAGWPAEQRELRAVLDEEINRLPEKYRRPLVLCYVEGLTQEAAARRLRWKAGVLRGRLDRARVRLRGRLARRGLAPAAILAFAELLGPSAQAAVAPALVTATLRPRDGTLTVGKSPGPSPPPRPRSWPATFLRRQFFVRAAAVAVLLASSTWHSPRCRGLASPAGSRIRHRVVQAPEPAASPAGKRSSRPPIGRSIFTSWTGAPASRSPACG